jgi:hypothetical protein
MKNKMKSVLLICFLFILPIQIVPTVSDSSETNITVAGGAGSYAVVIRGCSNEVLRKHKTSFTDVGVSVDHKFSSSPLRVGIRGNYIRDQELITNDDQTLQNGQEGFVDVETFTLNPFLNVESQKFAMGFGFMVGKNYIASKAVKLEERIKFPVSLYTRIGDPQKVYTTISYMYSVPLYSGNFTQIGFGSNQSQIFHWWIGLGGGYPYDRFGFLGKAQIRLQAPVYLNLSGRLGTSEGISENAFSLGLTFRIK